MCRLDLQDTTLTAISKMSEGNPGAMSALVDILQNGDEIDPQNIMGGMGVILSLDTHKIYGTDIYIIYNDKCDRDLRKMLMLLRSVQLGFLPESKLQEMAADQEYKVNLTDEEIDDLDNKVCEQLEGFQKPQ
jgi:hypothetical protein